MRIPCLASSWNGSLAFSPKRLRETILAAKAAGGKSKHQRGNDNGRDAEHHCFVDESGPRDYSLSNDPMPLSAG